MNLVRLDCLVVLLIEIGSSVAFSSATWLGLSRHRVCTPITLVTVYLLGLRDLNSHAVFRDPSTRSRWMQIQGNHWAWQSLYTPPAYAPRQSLVTQMALCTISPGENLFVTYY